LLVFGGEKEAMVQQAFNTNRHPRTAIGITKDKHLLLVTVDGRSAEAQGMTTEELAQLMQALGCTEALNLDGGGSTTMWISGKGTEGIVNYPSDNKVYDQKGERAVANSILVVKRSRK
jgi:exopolysaccharide biosynthesis protein